MSRPNMAGPTSARGAAGIDFDFADSVVLLMRLLSYGRRPWVLVKSLRSTSSDGVAGYDDYPHDGLNDAF